MKYESAVKAAELYPVPVNLSALRALALSDVRTFPVETSVFSTIPTHAIWFPVIKSGFSLSFSILE